jgi:2'-hydroxyisoflavone reductase
MHPTRRQLLEVSALAAAAGVLGPRALAFAAPPRRSKPLSLLILGGTSFLGPELVEAALARGHSLTLFNRGLTRPELFPELEKLRGDRKDDLKALEGRKFDAVLDTSGYFPSDVERSAGLLAPNVERYLFVSTVSVYDLEGARGTIDEASAVARITPEAVAVAESTRRITGGNYGALKALCEEAAEAAMPGRVAIVRPGLIVGPNDPTDRFTYWPVRVARGGEVLAPVGPQEPAQLVDVRDLAAFCVGLLEAEKTGTWIADGPAEPGTLGAVLETARAVSESDARFTWVPAEFLAEQDVAPWSDMPLWVPAPESGERASWSSAKAKEDGLRFRPLEETVRDTLDWFAAERGADAPLRAGLSREREALVLAAWRARGQNR